MNAAALASVLDLTDNRVRDRDLVIALCNSIRDEVIALIVTGKTPDHWDGHELRRLLADRFERETTSLMRDGRLPRRKRYENDRLTLNL